MDHNLKIAGAVPELMSSKAENALPESAEHSQQISLTKLLRSLKRTFPEFESSGEATAILVACAALGCRGILPHFLQQTAAGSLIQAYADQSDRRVRLDKTDFCEKNLEILASRQDSVIDSFISRNEGVIVKTLRSFHYSSGLQRSLAASWFKQVLIKASEDRREGSKKQASGHQERASLDHISALTQWFTPVWVADFLVDEAIEDNGDAKFLDPACGAGHLLVPALRKLVNLKDKRCNSSTAKIQEPLVESIFNALAHQVFGLDVDGEVLKFARFALYLESRDLSVCIGRDFFEFPALNIFEINDDSSGAGSLTLGAQELQARASIAQLQTPHSAPNVISHSTPDMISHSPPNVISHSPPNVIPESFDAIAMNPPYLGHRTMPAPIRNYLRREYPLSQYDLYAAFLDLGLRLLKPGSRMSAICQQSVLTIQRYESFRKHIINECNVESIVQLGSGTFASKSGEKTNSAIITLRKRGDVERPFIRCWQLLKKSEKRDAELRGLNLLTATNIDRKAATKVTESVAGTPFALFAPPEILSILCSTPNLSAQESGIFCTNGLFTCNNEFFVKRFDEISPDESEYYVPYDKGGGHKWYRTSDLMLRWKPDGKSIREFRVQRGQSAKLPGEEFYFKPGLTYSYIGTRGFRARLLTPDAVFDIASSGIFSEKINLFFLLGYLNSSLARSILGILNPTINFQIGDIRRLPLKYPQPDIESAVAEQTKTAVEIAAFLETLDKRSPRYCRGVNSDKKRIEELIKQEKIIDERIDQIVFDHFEVSQKTRIRLLADPWVARGANYFRHYAQSLMSST